MEISWPGSCSHQFCWLHNAAAFLLSHWLTEILELKMATHTHTLTSPQTFTSLPWIWVMQSEHPMPYGLHNLPCAQQRHGSPRMGDRPVGYSHNITGLYIPLQLSLERTSGPWAVWPYQYVRCYQAHISMGNIRMSKMEEPFWNPHFLYLYFWRPPCTISAPFSMLFHGCGSASWAPWIKDESKISWPPKPIATWGYASWRTIKQSIETHIVVLLQWNAKEMQWKSVGHRNALGGIFCKSRCFENENQKVGKLLTVQFHTQYLMLPGLISL